MCKRVFLCLQLLEKNFTDSLYVQLKSFSDDLLHSKHGRSKK